MTDNTTALPPLRIEHLLEPVDWNSAPGSAAFDTDSKGVAPFVNVIPDLQRKDCTVNSWWAGGYFAADGEVLGFIYNTLLASFPNGGGVIVENVSVANATTGEHCGGSKTYPLGEGTSVSTEEFQILTPTGRFQGDFNELHAAGTLDGASFDVRMRAASPAIFNGGTGHFPLAGLSFHQYSVPLLAARGTVSLGASTYQINGNGWFDRQWGDFSTGGGDAPPPAMDKVRWVWFGINLTSGDAISAWSAPDAVTGEFRSFATVLHSDRTQTVATAKFTVDREAAWHSNVTDNAYPLRWTLELPQLDTSLEIVSTIADQEFTMPLFGGGYEGMSTVSGTFRGNAAHGAARLELLGNI